METHSTSKRQEAYDLWQSGEKKSVISRKLHVDYDTLLGWIKRFEEEGVQGIQLRYDRCGRPKTIDERVRAKALLLRQAHAGWGCSYLRLHLIDEFGQQAVPSVRHIQRWMRSAGLIEAATRLPAVRTPWADKPLARVQVDAKEQLRCADGNPCCYLNFTDEHSGAVLDAFVFPL